jgi:hypothetical protein
MPGSEHARLTAASSSGKMVNQWILLREGRDETIKHSS